MGIPKLDGGVGSRLIMLTNRHIFQMTGADPPMCC